MKLKKEKNFLSTFIIALFLWCSIVFLVYFLSPTFFAIIVFLVLLFFALLFTLSLLFANTRRGILATLAGITFIVLRIFGLGNILNLLLILSLALVIEIYLARTR